MHTAQPFHLIQIYLGNLSIWMGKCFGVGELFYARNPPSCVHIKIFLNLPVEKGDSQVEGVS